MKRILALIMTLALIPTLISSTDGTDSEGHSLRELWKEYESAQRADKPQDQLKALQAIKDAARKQRLTWDYYDACDKYADVKTSINWKDREESQRVFRQEILEYGDPVAVYFLRRGEGDKAMLEYVSQHEAALRKGHNPAFYSRDYRLSRHRFSEALPELLANDWEYVLWSLYPAGGKLESEFTAYPMSALVEYAGIEQERGGRDAADKYEAYARKYEGKAAALLAKDALVSARMEDLAEKEGSTSQDFRNLLSECKDLIKERASFKGSEAAIAQCCTWCDGVKDRLESKDIGFSIKDGVLEVELQNLTGFDVQILKDKKKIWEKHLDNPVKSFFKTDKMSFTLPVLDDGLYVVECSQGKTKDSKEYEKYTISASVRWNADGPGIWATDYKSGEPLKKADLVLLNNGNTVQTVKDFVIRDGFTPLPSSFVQVLNDRKSSRNIQLRLREGGVSRASRPLSPGRYYAPDLLDKPTERHCAILTDRAAFNPDETVHFKAIIYYGRYTMHTAGKGESYDAVLENPKGEEIARASFTTGENGSFAGDFVLKRGERNGDYHLYIKKGGTIIGAKYLRVDDFVLPSFDLVFEKTPELFFPIEKIQLRGDLRAYSGHSLDGADIRYTVLHEGEPWTEGKLDLKGGSAFCIEFPADTASQEDWYDWYQVTVKVTDVTGETAEFQKGISVRRRDSREDDEPREYFFKDGDGLNVTVTAGQKPVWAVVELYGTGNKLLDKRLEYFTPKSGQNATLVVDYPYLDSYPSGVSLKILYFQDKKQYSHTLSRSRRNTAYDMPLAFERFLDTTAPGASYTFTLKTRPGAEVAATIFDKSTERFMGNNWNRISVAEYPEPYVQYRSECGTNDVEEHRYILRGRPMMTKGAMGSMTMARNASLDMMVMDDAVAEESVEYEMAAPGAAPDEGGGDIPIREDFATTIAWEPFLKAEADGTVRFSFTNADKLSTYFVQVFAHDKDMRNQALRKEMVVTIPVKISVVEPAFLYGGDRYEVRTGLSSSLDKTTGGSLTVTFYDGADYRNGKSLSEQRSSVSVPAGSSIQVQNGIAIPEGIDTLGIKLVFRPDDGAEGADGVFVTVPVKKAEQTLSEAHSAVLLDGADATALEKELRAQFVNIPGSKAVLKEISILDMLREAVPEEVKARSDNAIALAQALYAQALCGRLGKTVAFDREGTLAKLLACRNSDGGFAWFKGMPSSPMVTAVVLTTLKGEKLIDEASAVKYIDERFFNKDSNRWWFCGLSLNQYLYVRSLFPEVGFTQKTDKDFRKEVNEYLVPKKERGLNGWIFGKARRLLTLENLLASEGGIDLAGKWGIRFGAGKKMEKSLKADVESLVQYAVPHKGGGMYYPNAVMPWRGLLESELHAHTLLCKLMERYGHGDISNGIRLWTMLQKETQHWESDPGYIEALGAVLEGPESVLATKVLALSGSYSKPFEAIKATGNGMTISLDTQMPDTLKVGDRVKITWNITNEENRSFVRVTLPHSAGLMPVEQMSGYRWGYYRNVLPDRTELWYESYPEEKTSVTEEYYVTRAGRFQCPAAVIESFYAPHYTANTACPDPQEIR